MTRIKNVLNIAPCGCFIVQQAFVGERKATAEGPLNALQSSLEYIKLTCGSDLPPESVHERFFFALFSCILSSKCLSCKQTMFNISINIEQWQRLSKVFSFDTVTKNLQKSKHLIKATVYIEPWFIPLIETFLRMTVILLARGRPR